MPYFLGPEMGKLGLNRSVARSRRSVRAMFSLEMLGYYRDKPGTQNYPPPLGLIYSDRADQAVGDLGARGLVRRLDRGQKQCEVPSEGVAAPGFIRRHVLNHLVVSPTTAIRP